MAFFFTCLLKIASHGKYTSITTRFFDFWDTTLRLVVGLFPRCYVKLTFNLDPLLAPSHAHCQAMLFVLSLVYQLLIYLVSQIVSVFALRFKVVSFVSHAPPAHQSFSAGLCHVYIHVFSIRIEYRICSMVNIFPHSLQWGSSLCTHCNQFAADVK